MQTFENERMIIGNCHTQTGHMGALIIEPPLSARPPKKAYKHFDELRLREGPRLWGSEEPEKYPALDPFTEQNEGWGGSAGTRKERINAGSSRESSVCFLFPLLAPSLA